MKYIEPVSAVHLLNHLWQEELNQATYNTQPFASAYRKARVEFYQFMNRPRPERSSTAFFKRWQKRADHTGPMTQLMEWRTTAWGWIVGEQENMIKYVEEWPIGVEIARHDNGYGLWSKKDGWIMTPERN